MPASIFQGIFEALLQAVAEVVCYFTGRIIVPIFSLGQIQCEPLTGNGSRKKLRWSALFRRSGGQIYLTPEGTAGAGLIFILLVAGAVVGFFYFKN